MNEYSGKQISRAGSVLTQENIAEKNPVAFEEAMEVLSYWRMCHEEPLNSAVELLSNSVQKFDSKAVIAKRLKRTPSIINKLCRFSGMKLRSMQDIGGCRAILSNEKRVRKLVRELKKKRQFRIKDYIEFPKSDGYRSIHLVGDFSNGLGGVMPIEIQIRTAAQHSWATAVEIIDLFTGEAIKSNQGTAEWHKFFSCAAQQFALIEDIPLYNQIDKDKLAYEILIRLREGIVPKRQKAISENAATLYRLGEKLGILERFNAYASSLKAADEHFAKEATCGYVLLEIDLKQRWINSKLYNEEQFSEAAEAYLKAEKRAAVAAGFVIALVSTDAVGGIKQAFPNYFADSTLFIKYIFASIEAYREYNPTALGRALAKIFG